MKKDVPSGIGITLLSGDSEAIRRLLSTSSSSNSNWPSSSSVKNRGEKMRYYWLPGQKNYLFLEEKTKKELSLGMGLLFFVLLVLMDGLCCSSLQLSTPIGTPTWSPPRPA